MTDAVPGPHGDDRPGYRPRVGPGGAQVSQDGSSYWDGRHWQPLAIPFPPLAGGAASPGLTKPQYDGWVVLVVAAVTVLVLVPAAWLVPFLALIPFVLLIAVLMTGVTITSGPSTRRGRSVRQGLLIGSGITACISPVAACFSLFANSGL